MSTAPDVKIGSNFALDLKAAGLHGLPFSWGSDGSFEFGQSMTQEQIDGVLAVYAAHVPQEPPPL